MSVAERFTHAGWFPFCLDPIVTPADGVIGNLDANDVSQFFWNLETFTLSFSGSVTDGVITLNFTQTATSFPPAGSLTDQGRFYEGSAFPAAASVVSFASLPQDPVVPRERVCSSYSYFGFLYSASGTPGVFFIDIRFKIFSDLTNPGKYAIEYTLSAQFDLNSGGRNVGIYYQQPGGGGGGTLWTTGNMTIGGITFPWESYYAPPDIVTGGTMSASSSDFSYPP